MTDAKVWEGVGENQIRTKCQLAIYLGRGRKLAHKRGKGVGGNLMNWEFCFSRGRMGASK